MKRKQEKSVPTLFICSIIAGVVLLTGCYLKQKPPGSLSADQNVNGPQKVLRNHWNQFFSDVKKVDSRGKAHFDMAVYFQKRKKHNLALQEFQKAVQFDPTDAKIYNAMGISYDKSGNHKQAIQCYEMAIKLDPEMASAYNNLGYSKMLKGDTEGAIVAYQQAIELDDTNPRYRNNLAILYAKSGKIEQAREQLEVHDDELAAERKLDKLLGKSANSETREKPSVIPDILNEKTAHSIQTKEINLTAEAEETEDPQPEPEETKVVEIIYKNNLQPSNQLNKNEEVYPAVVAKEIEHPQQNLNELKTVEIIYKKDAQNSRRDSRDDLEVQSFVTTGITTSDPLKIAKPLTNVSTENSFALCSIGIVTETNNIADIIQEVDTRDYPSSTPVKKDNVSIVGKKALDNQPKLVEVIFREKTQQFERQKSPAKIKTKSDSHKSPNLNQISYESIKIIKVKSSNPNTNLSWLSVNQKSEKQFYNLKTDIEVANGNGIRGEARRFATYLETKGFKISKITNAESFDHSTTKVLFSGENFDIVYQLFDDLSYELDEKDLIELKRMGDRVRIIIGKDMALIDTPNDSKKDASVLAKK